LIFDTAHKTNVTKLLDANPMSATFPFANYGGNHFPVSPFRDSIHSFFSYADRVMTSIEAHEQPFGHLLGTIGAIRRRSQKKKPWRFATSS
jgi:hypothetical protein